MYEFEDFYQEPSEFEMQIGDFKQSLLNSVREEFKTEMERLRTENESLKEVKKNLSQIERDYESKTRQLEREREEMKRTVRRERFDELMGEAKVVMYSPEYYELDSRKCDRCNDKRQIEFTTPLGRLSKEDCTCKTKIRHWVPAENVLRKLSYDHNSKLRWVYYSVSKDRDYDSLEVKTDSSDNIYISGVTTYEEVEKNWYRRFYFSSLEDCQKFCVWKMEKDAALLPQDTESTESA